MLKSPLDIFILDCLGPEYLIHDSVQQTRTEPMVLGVCHMSAKHVSQRYPDLYTISPFLIQSYLKTALQIQTAALFIHFFLSGT